MYSGSIWLRHTLWALFINVPSDHMYTPLSPIPSPFRCRYRPPLLTTALPAMLLARALWGKFAEERRVTLLLLEPEHALLGLTLLLLPPLSMLLAPVGNSSDRQTSSSTCASSRLSSIMSYTSSALLFCRLRPFHSMISSPASKRSLWLVLVLKMYVNAMKRWIIIETETQVKREREKDKDREEREMSTGSS